MFGIFGLVVLMNGIFTTRVRKQEKLTREREARTNALYQLTRELSKVGGVEELVRVSKEEIFRHFSLESFIILIQENNHLPEVVNLSIGKELSPQEYSVSEWSYEHSTKAGHLTNKFPEAEFTYYPLTGAQLNPGVVALKQTRPFSPDEMILWDTFLTQISNALEREYLGQLAGKARFLDESDRFYKTLFNSVSHELRIPVATIFGASYALMDTFKTMGGIPMTLSHEIYTATNRLNRLIENLLNMSRLESGHLTIKQDWHDFNDLVNKLLNDLKDELESFSVYVDIPESLPLIRIDFGLMEQILYNLVYNCSQQAPVASEIRIKADYADGLLIIRVIDNGPGFPPSDLGNVFNKFFRADNKSPGGLGLGLSIVKGFTEAHNGKVMAENKPGGGAVVTITIPTDIPDMTEIPNDPVHE